MGQEELSLNYIDGRDSPCKPLWPESPHLLRGRMDCMQKTAPLVPGLKLEIHATAACGSLNNINLKRGHISIDAALSYYFVKFLQQSCLSIVSSFIVTVSVLFFKKSH